VLFGCVVRLKILRDRFLTACILAGVSGIANRCECARSPACAHRNCFALRACFVKLPGEQYPRPQRAVIRLATKQRPRQAEGGLYAILSAFYTLPFSILWRADFPCR